MLGMVVWLANNGNPPTGKTAAPFNGNCNDCHTGSAYNGNIEVTGFPATASPEQVYDINLKVTATLGSPSKAGFQLVVVDGNNTNCGDLINIMGGGTGTELLATREYIEQRNGKNFAGGMVSWDFQWKAPVTVPGNTIKVYYISNLCNGNGGTSGDNPIWDNLSFAFSGPPPVSAAIDDFNHPTCNGSNNGNATVEASGGTPPYTYAWTGGQTTQTAVNLVAGTYTVTVTATGGGGTATASVTLTQPAVMTLSASVSGTVTCITTATATAAAGGGTPGYTYQWADGQTDAVAVFDQPGTYAVTATDSKGCTKVVTANVPGNTAPPLAVVASGAQISCTSLQTQLNGSGSSTGPNFSYLWTGPGIVSGQGTLTPTVNQCGVYTLTVTNIANGCTATASTTVTCNINPPNASASGGEITCVVLSVTLAGNSTTPNVTFAWSGPGITPGNQFQQNPTVELPGVYTLTVTNTNTGCTQTASATVVANNAPPTAIASASGALTCVASSVNLNLSTNAPNAVFAWTGPNGFSSNLQSPSVSLSGDYIGGVTNPANGCQAFDTVTVTQNIVPPGASATVSGPLNCLNDTVQLFGSSPFFPDVTFAWSGPNFNANLQNPLVNTPGNYLLTVTGNANGCTSGVSITVLENISAPFDSIVPPGNLNCNNSSIQLNATPSSQGPNFDYLWTAKEGGHIVSGDTTLTPVVDSTGKYFLRITNTDNGCTAIDSVVLKQSPAVLASIAAFSPVSCNGGSNGSATVTGAGGNGVFSYLWSNGATNDSITGLSAGVYIATVTDGENCSASVSVTIAQPDLLLANASASGETALGANDGTATANPDGGTGAYSFAWSNTGNTQSINNLSPGSYTVSVTDEQGCTVVQTVTVNAFGCNLQATLNASNASCQGSNDGLASVSVSGAVNPVSYIWSNGETTQSVNNLAPGTYSVSILDGNNCPAVLSASVGEPPALSANASATGVSANGANDGTATATPVGGSPGFTFVWSNSETSQSISGLAAGTYTVVVTDANGCSDTQTVQVAAFNCAVSASIASANALCFGESNGQATVTLSNGILPFSYVWDNGASTQTIGNLPAGTYTATVTDAAGCSASATVAITQPNVLAFAGISVQNVICPQDINGSVTFSVSGGTAPYSFDLPGGNGSGLGVGTYTLTVTDNNNCSVSATFSIQSTDSQPPVMSCPANMQVCGPGFIDYGTPSVSDNCGVAGLPVILSGPASGSVFDEGNYLVVYQATDVSGNEATCSFSIVVSGVSDILIDNISNDVNGQNVGSISVTPVGVGGFTYAWDKNGQPFATTEDLTGLSAGIYTLTITDANNCTSALAPIEITNTVGTSEAGNMGSVRLWPNPAQDYIRLEIIDLDIIAAHIVDLRGGLVKNIPPTELFGDIDLQGLPEAMYCLKIMASNGQVLSLKFVHSR